MIQMITHCIAFMLGGSLGVIAAGLCRAANRSS